ncbi:hypothetical protein [Nitrospirillum sp. BR 11828]|uniref:hypothetical protein n=1 Tax=Nitrospirillum sp. BR 11828 TaxID=3104325 RepID=UPI002ACA7073|nr:hypothetical protein [Nitrospirillum sp. BR 11828]MDZ5650725.1 hypothetical protein [Nitrospirillum sp. BR 11828]
MSPAEEERARTLSDLVDRLSPEAARKLFEEVDASPDQSRAVVRRALIQKLNAQRQAHARRQFTQLFEPFLTSDPWLLREEFHCPGSIHPLDVGGLWSALAAKPLAPLSRSVDETLSALAQEQPLFVVLRTPKALALREELRVAAAARLGQTLPDKAATKDLLEAMNAWRRAEATRKGLGFVPRPLTATDLSLLHVLLENGSHYSRLVLGLNSDDEGGGAEDAAAVVAFQPPSVPPPQAAQLALLMPLVLLNRHRAYRQMSGYLVQGPADWQPVLLSALVRHLARTCQVLADELGQLAGAGEVARRPLVVASDRRELLERELIHLDDLLTLFDEFDMLRDGREASLAHGNLDTMIKKVEGTLYPYLSTRVSVTAHAKGRAALDHAALAWALGYTMRWRNTLTRSLHWGTRYSDFRDRLVEDLTDAYRAAFSRTEVGDSRERLGQAVRAAELSQAVGADLRESMTLLDQGLVQTATDRLRDATPLTGAEITLITTLLTKAQNELRRTKHWRDANLVTFVTLAEERRLGNAG